MAKLYVCGGDKGGVGKTCCAISLAESLISSGQQPVLFDGDPTNSDFNSRYSAATRVDITSLESWGQILEAASAAPAVLNLPARGNQVFAEHGESIAEAAAELGVEIMYLHVMNRQKDSLTLLAAAIERVGSFAKVVAVRNLYFGDANKFALFNASNTRKKCAGELDLPELADHVADAIQTAKAGQSLQDTAAGMKALDRAILNKWLRASTEIWSPLFEV